MDKQQQEKIKKILTSLLETLIRYRTARRTLASKNSTVPKNMRYISKITKLISKNFETFRPYKYSQPCLQKNR